MGRGGERAGNGQPVRKPRRRCRSVLVLCLQAGQVGLRPWAAAAKSPSVRGWSKADAPAGSEAGGRAPPGGRRRQAQPGEADCKIRETEAGSGGSSNGISSRFQPHFTDRETEKGRRTRMGKEPLKPRASRHQLKES